MTTGVVDARGTFPPCTASRNLSDGTPLLVPPLSPPLSSAGGGVGMDVAVPVLAVPESPCLPLLPHWLSLHLLRDLLLPLLLLQLLALKAYVWAHEGVLADMAERLKRADASSLPTADKDGNHKSSGGNDGGGTATRWALYALSLGAVQIAESVRSIVIRANF